MRGACKLLTARKCCSGAPHESIFRAGSIPARADPTSLGLGKPCLEQSLQSLGEGLFYNSAMLKAHSRCLEVLLSKIEAINLAEGAAGMLLAASWNVGPGVEVWARSWLH